MSCAYGFDCVPADGPENAEVMCVGEAPGIVEQYQHTPLVGPTGQEFNRTYLPLAGLRREDVYVINTVNHTSTINRKPTMEDIAKCSRCMLEPALRMVEPKVVVLMGATACSLVDDIDLEAEHGIPRIAKLFGVERVVVPMWHPALGLHKTGMMGQLLDDCKKFGEWLECIRGEDEGAITDGGPYVHEPERTRYYTAVRTLRELEEYTTYTIAFSNPPWRLCAIDTETHNGVPFSLQFSTDVGTAGLIVLGGAGVLVEEFRLWFWEAVSKGMEVVMHNAPADIDVVKEVVGREREFRFRDTMQEAYHLGLPQGLKALSYRLLGRKRKSWEETVTPKSKDKLVEWISEAIVYAEGNWTKVEERVGKKGNVLKPKVTTSETERVLRSVLKHACESEEYDPWGKIIERVDGFDLESLQAVIGEVPAKGVKWLSEEELVEYGCSDADDTLAVELELERMRGEFLEVSEGDVDAV